MTNFNWINFSNPVAIWWIFLCGASIVNITGWTWTRFHLYKSASFKKFNFTQFRVENLIWFSGIYVFGCAYRSVFTKADVQRICLFDTWLSSVFLGRSVATIAEVAFIIQWAIVIRYLSRETNSQIAKVISYIIVPVIIIAEVFSWFAVITTNYLGNTIEESLWTLTYIFIMIALVKLRSKFRGALLYAINISIISCLIYVLFMIFVDVAMYFKRWQIDLQNEKPYFSFQQGIFDLNTRWVVTYNINDWRSEIPWMSLYFSIAVLISIALCYVPIKRVDLQKYLKI